MSSPKDSAQARAVAHLRDVRVAAGITQADMAALMVDRGFKWIQTTVTKTEAGTRPLMLDEFVGMCMVLGLEPGLTLTMTRGPQISREMKLASLRASITSAQRELKDAEDRALVRRTELAELNQKVERLEADTP